MPCAGRVQPESLLKALEAGADVVCVVTCEPDNCHYVEGCRRAIARVEYVQRLLAEAGLEPRRVMLRHLPGSAREDMMVGAGGETADAVLTEELPSKVSAIRDEVAARVRSLPPNPLRDAPRPAAGADGDGSPQ